MYLGLGLGLPMGTTQLTATSKLLQIGGLTFFKDFVGNISTLNADYAAGSPTATFTASRGVSNPATIINSAGVVSTVTTSNTARNVGGYYDDTGFHAQKGFLSEDNITNTLIQSNGFTDVAWTATLLNVAANDPATSPDGSITVGSLTSTDINGTLVQSFVDAIAGVYTASVWLKRKTGSGTIDLRANALDSYTPITVTSSWCRFQVQSSSLTNPSFDIQLESSGDAVYIFGAQLEKLPFATSYIPTTTAALSRNLQILSYSPATNRTVSAETVFVRCAYNKTATASQNARALSDIDPDRRLFSKFGGGSHADISMAPNFTVNAGVAVATSTIPQSNIMYTFTGLAQHVSPYIKLYTNGVLEGQYTVGDWTDNAFGAKFYVGSALSGFNAIDGILTSMAIFNRALTDAEVAAVHVILSSI